MRNIISTIALGVALAAGTSAAQAQTMVETVVTPAPGPLVIAQAPVTVPPSGVLLAQPAPTVATAPVETLETVRTVRTTTAPRTVGRHVTRPRMRTARRVTTTRTTTTVRRGIITTPDVVATAAYNELVQGPPLYDVVVPAPAVAPVATRPVVPAAAPATTVPLYRYVYEPDRILVIDPYTNIAVQAIPR